MQAAIIAPGSAKDLQEAARQAMILVSAYLLPKTEQMANSAQARKRARQALVARAHNASQRSRLRTAIKAVRKAVEAGDKASAQQVFQQSVSVIDSLADKDIVHKNAAARHKSRLSAAIKAMGAAA